MFTPKAFKINDQEQILSFIATHPLASVIAYTADGLEASHIPMYWEDDGSALGCLYGHLTRTNALNHSDHLKSPWLIIFQNAGHYISPNWYPSKAATHKAVPTWNYQAVHVSGKVDILTDADTLIEILTQQTADFAASQQHLGRLTMPQSLILQQCVVLSLAYALRLLTFKPSLN